MSREDFLKFGFNLLFQVLRDGLPPDKNKGLIMIIFIIAAILVLAALAAFICLLIHLIIWLTKSCVKGSA